MQPLPDADIVLRWCRAGLEALAAAREEIDAINVFPVPDADTGTNLYLTLEAAVGAAEERAGDDLPAVAAAMAGGAFVGARGNSGVILAQMLRGVAEVLEGPGASLADGTALAAGLDRAATSARLAVAEPVEGTMLSVARAAADAALERAAQPASTLLAVARAAAAAGRTALDRTPDQLDVLRAAHVVDAGGRGLSVLLDSFDTVLTGRRPVSAPRRVGGHHLVPSPLPVSDAGAVATPAFEVMYLLDAVDAAVPVLRAELAALGTSLVVVGGDGRWNVHVHVDDAGAAVEAGMRAGRPHRIAVNHLEPVGHRGPVSRSIIAFAAGDGLAELFASAGATVVRLSPGHRASGGEMLRAVDTHHSGEVVILPNEREAVPVAEAAAAQARAAGLRAAVIPTVAQVQGLAAIAVQEPARSFDADVVAMTAAAGHTRHGAVTVATREAVTMAGICRTGDVLGVIEGDFAVIGSDILEVATDVVERMLAAGGELVTLVAGAGADDTLTDGVLAAVQRTHPEVDTVLYTGGQPRYPLLLGVE